MADYRVDRSVAVIEVKNPPVNALSSNVRKSIKDHTERAEADPAVSSIVLIGQGRTFPAGADITEFAGRNFQDGPTLSDVCNTLESSSKPTIVAVHGTALGGGCEICISAHYRVADKNARFGFPEVDLGILPGATGTQRFPRLVGIEVALKHIPTGQQFGTKEGLKYGMIDKVVENNLLEEAIQFARSVAHKPFQNRRTSKKPVKDAHKAHALAGAALQKAAQKSKGMLAPVFCIKSVLAAVEYPFEEGVQKESEYSITLFSSGQAQALQYAFFAQRAATKWSLPGGISRATVKPQPVKTAAVIGAGTMGTGIAMTMLNAGIPVILLEQNQEFLKKGVGALKDLYAGSVRLGKLSQDQARKILSQLKPTVSFSDLKNVDLVIEAVYEDMSLKQDVFRKLDKACKPSAILCSNTSNLDIDKMASVTSRPDKVIGTHFFVPAYYMRMLENVRGAKSSPETMATVTALGTRIGKVPVLVGNCYGFVGNRMQAAYSIEAFFLVEEGATPEYVDETVENFGMALGRFKVADLSGLDIGWRAKAKLAKAKGVEVNRRGRFVNGVRTSYLSDILCEQGRFGRKTGKGWYKYEKPGAKEPFVDPVVQDLIEKYRRDNSIEGRQISTQEIVERCFYGLINEGFKILEEGIAAKPEDIDTIWLLGYSWPRQTGGPMYYANTVGIPKIYERVCYYYRLNPTSPHWQPSELMRRVAENNTPMQGWTRHISARL